MSILYKSFYYRSYFRWTICFVCNAKVGPKPKNTPGSDRLLWTSPAPLSSYEGDLFRIIAGDEYTLWKV